MISTTSPLTFIFSTAILLVSFVFILDWLLNRFYLTNFRVIKERGIIGKKYTSIWLVKIQDVTIQFGIWGRIFGFGDLLIESAGVLGQENFNGLAAPLEVQRFIEEQLKAIPSSLI